MCHTLLQDPKLYVLLSHIDEEQAAEVRSAGCGCGGALHSARYPRKPRGTPPRLPPSYDSRHSFCCARCRRRSTPVSVRYLGRRIYLAAVVVLSCAMRAGVTHKRAKQLTLMLNVPLRTLERWRCWWLGEFVHTPFWRGACSVFMPPVAADLLPASLLSRFAGDERATPLVQCLSFLSPLSTLSKGR